ncbi:retrovirus-related pol polyprotein from transposon TNT 1-94 [Tanacetum coccineum]
MYVCPAVGPTCADTMAGMNMPANECSAKQAPAICIHQSRSDESNIVTGLYNCQLDEQWFNLHKDILRDALDITPSNDNNPFVAPPSSDTVIEYVNTLGYPCILRNVSAMSVNALYQPWRAILSMINMCFTGKTVGYDRPRHLVLQILWGITHRSNIDYAERIWEEFLSRGKKKTAHMLIPNVRKDGREIFGMPIHNALLTNAIKSAPYYSSYLEHVTEYQRYLNEEHDKADDKSPEPASLQLVDKVVDEGVPEKEPAHGDEEANLQRVLELSLKELGERTQGPARLVVIREPDSRRIQPLPETPKLKNPADQFIFQRRTPMPNEPSKHADHSALDAELALTDSETESEEEVLVIKAGDQDEDQAGPNPDEQDKGQAGSNPGDAAESQPQPSHVVHAGPNLEHMDLETTDSSIQQKPKQIDEEFTTTAYPNVQENLKLLTEDQVILEEPASSTRTLSSLQNLDKDLSFTNQFFVEKPREKEPGKTNAEAEVQSMVSVPIHQDTSSVPPTTTPVIDLTKSQSDSLLPTSTATTSIITTTTLSPPPLQSTTDPILVRRIGELEQHIANLIQNNLVLEERLDKHGSRLYKLENLNIPHQVSKVVEEIVTDAVDWAMQAPLRARFRDLPTVDMKEILQQRMFEDNTYMTHEVHNDLYEALQKSVELGLYSISNDSWLCNKARKKKRKRRESTRTPPGSLPTQPPPPAGASGAPGTSGASGSSQLPLPPPPPSIGTSGYAQQQGSQAPSSSKTVASASQSMAWTTSDTQYESADIPGAQEFISQLTILMQDDSFLKSSTFCRYEELPRMITNQKLT